jgi:SPP1 family predicted phage head-tail adaptor
MANPLLFHAGTLFHSIQIQAASSTRDATGQLVSTWNTILTTRASIENTSGASYRESFSGNELVANSTDLITIRYQSSVTIEPGQRVIKGNDTFLIQAVDNVLRRNVKLRLACLLIDGNSQ